MISIAVCGDEADDIENTADILRETLEAHKTDYDLKTFLSVNEMLDSLKKIDAGVLDASMDGAGVMKFHKLTGGGGKYHPSLTLSLRDIIYFEYGKRSRRISIILSDETYECDCIFGKLAEKLRHHDFSVNCRGNLVNLRHIEKIKGYSIYMDNGKELPLAQKRSAAFRKRMNEFLQKNS